MFDIFYAVYVNRQRADFLGIFYYVRYTKYFMTLFIGYTFIVKGMHTNILDWCKILPQAGT